MAVLSPVSHPGTDRNLPHANCEILFQKSPVTHLQVTPPVTASDLDYFANKLESHRNLREHVGNILIPRVSGTQGNKQVRQVRKVNFAGKPCPADCPRVRKVPIGLNWRHFGCRQYRVVKHI